VPGVGAKVGHIRSAYLIHPQRGWDNAKKVNGRKRHIAVDTTGLVPDVVITAASVQDCRGARPLLWNTHRACRRVRLV
jgi:hypothetical protein